MERRRWIPAQDFEDAIAAVNLLPGPASTQLSISCANRLRGRLGALVAATIGPYLILVLLACGVVSLATRRRTLLSVAVLPVASVLGGGLAWTALKVGALSYGGGFVIIPLMQGDAVDAHHWMTDAQFLNAVAAAGVAGAVIYGAT